VNALPRVVVHTRRRVRPGAVTAIAARNWTCISASHSLAPAADMVAVADTVRLRAMAVAEAVPRRVTAVEAAREVIVAAVAAAHMVLRPVADILVAAATVRVATVPAEGAVIVRVVVVDTIARGKDNANQLR
jgi:hypothetical protein